VKITRPQRRRLPTAPAVNAAIGRYTFRAACLRARGGGAASRRVRRWGRGSDYGMVTGAVRLPHVGSDAEIGTAAFSSLGAGGSGVAGRGGRLAGAAGAAAPSGARTTGAGAGAHATESSVPAARQRAMKKRATA
jgi:hypothetical protein